MEFGVNAYTESHSSTPIPQVPGDGNGYGYVDGQDFIIWLIHYDQQAPNPENCDYNNDHTVEFKDYTIWIGNYKT